MVKVYPGEYSLVDLAEIGADPRARTATTPFGPGGMRRYVGRAVKWKGKKVPGAHEMTPEEIALAMGLEGSPEAYGGLVAHGVSKISKISYGVQNVRGVGVGTISGTRKRVVRLWNGERREYEVPYSKSGIFPARCFEIAKKHDKNVRYKKFTTVREATAPVPYPPVVAPIPVSV